MNNTTPPTKRSQSSTRRLFKPIAALLVLILLSLTGLHLALKHHCTELAQTHLLPWLQTRYQTDVNLGRISINMLTGTLIVEELDLNNPPGFSSGNMLHLPFFRLRLALPDLWRKNSITIRSLRIKDARVNLIRNRQGVINLAISEPTPSADTAAQPSAVAAETPETAATLPIPDATNLTARLALDRAKIKAHFFYTDHSILFHPTPLQLEFDLQIALANIANYGASDVMSGSFTIDGTIQSEGATVPLELRGRLAPLSDPTQLTCEAMGSTRALNLTNAPLLAERLKIAEGKIACAIAATTQDGVFDGAKSFLKLHFSDVKSKPEPHQRWYGMALPRAFTIEIPISGTVNAPQMDFAAALARFLVNDENIRSLWQELRKTTEQGDQR